jgi:hypothetical protein
MFNSTEGNPIITNCTFTGNTAEDGGGVWSNNNSSLMLTNCILWGNTATRGPQLALYDNSSMAIDYCDLQGGLPGIVVSPGSFVTWGPGNTDTDPLFVDAANADYHLQAESPCINAGDNSAIPESVVTDIDGKPRILNGIVDMGAYEFGIAPITDKIKYGGTGEHDEPYRIATVEDLMLLGETPKDYDKHFILTADIDLDPNLPGRKVFDRAVIAPDTNDIKEGIQGAYFTGVFDGNGHTISHLTIKGESFLGLFGSLFRGGADGAIISNLRIEAVDVNGAGDYVGGLVGYNTGSIITTYISGAVIGKEFVGGLMGYNSAIFEDGTMNYSTIDSCCSSVDVSGDDYVGGLVGTNLYGTITNCYATGSVVASPTDLWSPGGVGGGLVGDNWHIISNCYTTGRVLASDTKWSPGVGGGLVGENNGEVMYSFWDTQTSGQAASGGGTPKTTAEMQTASTFLKAGWDFVDETENGTEDIWWILEGQDYPKLWWELIPEN